MMMTPYRRLSFLSLLVLAPLARSTHAETRNILQHPFASDSIWNMPIGSNAVYQFAGITTPPGSVGEDDDVIILTPTAPMTSVYTNAAGWQANAKNRCDFTLWPITKTTLSVPVPTNFVLNNTVVSKDL